MSKRKGRRLDLSDWDIPLDEVNKAAELARALKAAELIIGAAVAEDGIDVSFPYEWETSDGMLGPRPKHPMIIYAIVRSLTDAIGNDVVHWSADLRDVVRELAADHSSSDGKIHADSATTIAEIRDGFLELAKILTDAMPEPAS